jgi:hypothetical protein
MAPNFTHFRSKVTKTNLSKSEFLSEEPIYWKFIEIVEEKPTVKFNSNLNSQKDEENYENILNICTKLGLSPLKLQMLKFSLSLRNFSPKVVTFSKLAAQDSNSLQIQKRGENSFFKTIEE